MAQQSYRRELERNRIARLKRELRLKEEEQQLEKVLLPPPLKIFKILYLENLGRSVEGIKR